MKRQRLRLVCGTTSALLVTLALPGCGGTASYSAALKGNFMTACLSGVSASTPAGADCRCILSRLEKTVSVSSMTRDVAAAKSEPEPPLFASAAHTCAGQLEAAHQLVAGAAEQYIGTPTLAAISACLQKVGVSVDPSTATTDASTGVNFVIGSLSSDNFGLAVGSADQIGKWQINLVSNGYQFMQGDGLKAAVASKQPLSAATKSALAGCITDLG
jgi:hypothetical protein